MKPFTKALLCGLAFLFAGNADAKSFLRAGEYLRNDQVLASENRAFFAYMQSDGNFVVYKGTSFQDMYGSLWATGAKGGGQYFAIQQGDGNFVVYAGTGPSDNRGFVWHHGRTGGTGQAFTILQDSGNLCTYKGTGPSDNKGLLWCSDKYVTAVTWLPDGKEIAMIGGRFAGLKIFSGQWQDGPFENTRGTWLRNKNQRWVFMPDTTLRLASDRTKCFRTNKISELAETGPCDSAEARGWSYRASDKSIRKSDSPKGCLRPNMSGIGWLHVMLEPNCLLDGKYADQEARDLSTWKLQ
jgi:hypothetical protein